MNGKKLQGEDPSQDENEEKKQRSGRRRNRKGEETPPDTSKSWLTTFTDLVTLLLTFFILLLSMSVLDELRQQKVLESLSGAFGFMFGGRSALGTDRKVDPRDFSSPIVEPYPVDSDMLREVTMRNNLDEDVEIIEKDDQIIIRLNSKLLFEPGSAVLLQTIESYLAALARYLAQGGAKLAIQGHTDIREVMHASDIERLSWVLSTSRAQAVHDFFVQKGVDHELMAARGYAHLHPLRDGIEFIDYFEENRRVDIVVSDKAAIPAYLDKARDEIRPAFSYKNFLFRLLPGGGD